VRDLGHSLPLKLLKAREAVMDRFRPSLNAHSLTEQQWRVIRALMEVDGLDAGELARRVTLRMPSLSRILRDLDARQLIRKRRSAQDRRLVNVSLTQAGRQLFAKISPISETVYTDIEADLSPQFYREVMEMLDLIIAKLPPQRG
jgi:homoprotocatechuate degradation regulator HpaR